MLFLLLEIMYKEGKSGNKAIVISPIKNFERLLHSIVKFLRSIIIIFFKTHLH